LEKASKANILFYAQEIFGIRMMMITYKNSDKKEHIFVKCITRKNLHSKETTIRDQKNKCSYLKHKYYVRG
jgi:hypothetical protein